MQKITVVLWVLLGCFGLAQAHEPELPEDISSLSLQQLGQGVFVLEGPQAFPAPETAGFMNNPAFIITPAGIVVVDPGSSLQIGRLLLQKMQEVSAAPLVAVFNTHVHGDHWLGNQAMREQYPAVPIYAHQRMIALVEAGEGEAWITNFMQSTDGAIEGTGVVAPNIGLSGGERLVLGGEEFRIHHTGTAHTDHDIIIEFPAEKTVFPGDVVTNRRIQSARPADASIKGQIEAIEFVLGLDAEIYVPGHGAPGGRDIALEHLQFLRDFYASVERHYTDGKSDYEMKASVESDLAAYREWQNFNELGRVLSQVYLQVEEDSF